MIMKASGVLLLEFEPVDIERYGKNGLNGGMLKSRLLVYYHRRWQKKLT